MSVNPRVQAAIEKAAALKMAEQGEPLTEQEISRIYIGQYMQDRKAGQLDDYEPEERAELEKIYQAQQDRLLKYLAKIVSDVKAGNYDDYGDDDPEGLKQIADQLLAGDKAAQIKKIIQEESGEPGKKYRTRSDARKAGAITKLPTSLAVITDKNYQYSMSLYQKGGAYLQPFTSTDKLRFEGGRMYFENSEKAGFMQEISEMELQNLQTKEGIENINLPLLRIFYSVVLDQFQATNFKELKDIVRIPIPLLAEYMGLQRNLNKEKTDKLIADVQSFHNIVGVMNVTRKSSGKKDKAYYQVLNFEYYDPNNNIIAFSSPYMNYLIQVIYNVSIRRDKNGKPKLKKNGDPLRLATHSYLINSDIVKERNKAAIENVVIIVQLIEQAGDNIPRIKASTLIERNPQLQERLESSANKRQLLKRTFSKTWELLRDKTRLTEFYDGIELPDPKDPKYLPNETELENLVIYFNHNGKKQEGLQGK